MNDSSKARWTLIVLIGSLCLLGILTIKIFPTKKLSHQQAQKKIGQTETLFEKRSREMGIVIGTPADDVLEIRGKSLVTEVMGKNENGLIVEWEYPDGIYVMRRWTIDGVTCYRVAEMKLGP